MAKTRARRVWMSFDLGVQGDYEGLYAWLDRQEAEECGDNVATFLFRYRGDDAAVDVLSSVKKAVTLTKRSRIYVSRSDGDGKAYVGKFIYGKRKVALWKGYAATGPDEDDE
jgi:hypothetical protein